MHSIIELLKMFECPINPGNEWYDALVNTLSTKNWPIEFYFPLMNAYKNGIESDNMEENFKSIVQKMIEEKEEKKYPEYRKDIDPLFLDLCKTKNN